MGPSGYDHQVAGKCFVLTYSLHRVSGWSCLPLSVLLLRVAVCRVAQLAFGQADIRVAVAMGLSQFRCVFELTLFWLNLAQFKLITGGDFIFGVYEVNWMLVVLGSTYYYAYTYTLSTWSSSTLL